MTAQSDAAPTASRLPFLLAICTGSFLLFLVQPMIARMALPRLGGAPAVWNSAMLVYQALLLGGYAWAHWLGRFSGRTQARLHVGLALVGLLMLPIALMDTQLPADANPFLWVPWLLLGSIGPLFFVVSAQAPLLQRWYGLSGGADPYPLYSASNLGSFAGLIAYPLIVEPLLPVKAQSLVWSTGYVILLVMTAYVGWRVPAHAAADTESMATDPAPSTRSMAWWVLLAAIPSALMLSTTLHLTTDVMAMPLLWVVPLGLYLLSFSIAFADNRGPANLAIRLAPLTLLFSGYGLFRSESTIIMVFVGASVLSLFLVAIALHARMFDERPAPAHLTRFYFAMSLGGVVGGLFGALFAPLVFDWTYEHPILLLASAMLLTGRPMLSLLRDADETRLRRFGAAFILIGIVLAMGANEWLTESLTQPSRLVGSILLIVMAVASLGHRKLFTAMLALLMLTMGGGLKLQQSFEGRMTRSFFGIYTIRDYPNHIRYLVHGTTSHGVQMQTPDREREATSYYTATSGVGMAIKAAPALFGPKAQISVVGLGAGTLACYAQPGQDWRFYEIDPAIADIAKDPKRFTYLSNCTPDAPILIGDARLVLEQQKQGQRDLLAVDAFSSDSVPMHLLTREAFAVYGRYLKPDGLLMIHISNRYLGLEPVLAAARLSGWQTMIRYDRPKRDEKNITLTGSAWVALSRNQRTLDALSKLTPKDSWEPLAKGREPLVWTDDHASILPIIKWQWPF
jgi:spermidine synthase